MTENAPQMIYESRAGAADGLAWLPEARALLFCDRTNGKVGAISLADLGVTQSAVGGRPGLAFPTADGRLLYASERDIFSIGHDGNRRREMPIDTYSVNSALIGTVDSKGRLWFGMEDHAGNNRRGGLFRYHDERLVPMVFDQVRPGGVAVTPDAAILYQAVASAGRIDRHEVNRAGALSNGTTLIDLNKGEGEPRGLALDSDGHLWVALDGAGEIARYAPTGECVSKTRLPSGQPRDLAFGGDAMTDLFVSTKADSGGSAIYRLDMSVAGQSIAPVRLSHGASLGLVEDDDH